MAYVLGSLFFTSSAQPNTVYIGPSNFSSAPDNYQLAFDCYDVLSGFGGVQIRAIIGNQTAQQFLPGTACVVPVVGLNIVVVAPTDGLDLGSIVDPPAPTNVSLDDSTTSTLINITWNRSEGINPAIVTYQLIYSLTRLNGSTDNGEVLVSSCVCVCVCVYLVCVYVCLCVSMCVCVCVCVCV